jgi:aspartate/methionine/tyrosine aminotransferase
MRPCPERKARALGRQVYEHLVFEGSHHRSLRTFPGMADRTVRVGSAGKTLSFTAWKVRSFCVREGVACGWRLWERSGRKCEAISVHSCISCVFGVFAVGWKAYLAAQLQRRLVAQIGWVTGPARLVAAVSKAHQFVTFTVASSLQRAVAYGLDHEAVFYTCASPLPSSTEAATHMHERV